MRKTSALVAATAIAATAVAMPIAAGTANAASPTPGDSAANTATTAATGATAIPSFDFSDCPQLPAGVDPAEWRCEVLVADGTLHIGGSALPFHFTAVTHAEGPMTDGTPGQVFGGFRAARLPLPGRQSGDGHGSKLWAQPQLAVVPDFYSQSGAMSLTFQLSGPALEAECSIGTPGAPVEVAAARVPGSTQWVSQEPPVIAFDVRDVALAVPEASGCGRRSEELDRRFGLPSASGANQLEGSVFYSFKTYDRL